jgi:MOSC domain-containing protein YiiM
MRARATCTAREVLFASADHLRTVDMEPGTIKENFTVEGADVQEWPVGQRPRPVTPSAR